MRLINYLTLVFVLALALVPAVAVAQDYGD